MSEQSTGRSRGRARGRARGGVDQPQKRPGDAPQAPPPSAGRGRSRGAVAESTTVAAAPSQAAPAAPTGGRTSHRGGARSAADVKSATTGMAQMSLGTGDAQPPGRKGRSNDDEANTRPAHICDKSGCSGQAVQLISNFFEITQHRQGSFLYQYAVSFKPPIENKGLRIALVSSHKEIIGETRAFDGAQLFLPHKLPNNPTVFTAVRNYDNEKIEVSIQFVDELPQSSPTCIQIMNIIFRKDLAIMGMRQIGRHYFNPEQSISVEEHKMEVWPGFSTSICPYESKVMLCIDLSHKVLRKATVLDQMYDIRQRSRDRFKDECIKQIVGEIVLTKYNNKTYRVDDIDWNQNPRSTFKARDKDLSYMDYYEKNHNKNIQDEGQPLLVTLPKKRDIRAGQEGPIYLIPELCYLTGLSDQIRNDFRVMRDLATHTRIGPSGRVDRLTKFISKLSANPDVKKEMSGWGLEFASHLVRVPARQLHPEKIFQKQKTYSYKIQEADWTRDMRGAQLISAIAVRNWAVIYSQRDSQTAQDMAQTIIRVADPMGMRMAPPALTQLRDDRVESYVHALQSEVTKETQLVVCVVPNNRKDRYDAIKKFCCVTHPVASQVIVGRTIAKKQMLMSVCTKVAIQLNCKLGGEVWALEIPLKNSMVIGIDTYHERKQRSVGGFVASLNASYTRYYSKATVFDAQQEVHDHLKFMMTGALTKYFTVNKVLPDKIIVYRDGVGDGQLACIAQNELPQVLDSIRCFAAELGVDKYPQVTMVVVKKRLSTRFFQQSGREAGNPPPGTIVDDVVTRKNWYDFFVISQSVRQGTVSPTHYNVIHDGTGIKPDHIQRLTYKLTHLYYNWPGTIRVPAPCQYAHKLAFLVGQSLKTEPSPALSETLFYL
ncbi:piwi-like protein 1 [Lineus longissimus]|uniref:piwi-like protein 1 n=1 Tax=Lineus longissimus TaxID=88925 RepID=UPI002B4F06B7